MSNGEAAMCTVFFILVMFLIVALVKEVTELKCIKSGCDNKQA